MLRALIDHCVHRRVAVVALTLAFALFGVRAYLNTPIEAYPDVTDVQVFVIAQGPGLAPEEMERQVTVPLERALNGTPGMTGMRSETYFGLSMLILTFEDKFDSFKARLLTSERIRNADLPDAIVPELAPDATPLGKIFIYRLKSDRHTLYELRSEQEWNVAKRLRRIPGVADVFTFGGFYKELHVQADPARLSAHGLTLLDVADALEQSNLNVGGGFLPQGDQELVIRGIGYLSSADDIRKVVLRSKGGTPVTVGDIARVVQSHTPRRGSVALDENREDVEGIVLLRRGQNPTRVLDALHDKVQEINRTVLPKGMQIEVLYDRSSLIGKTLETVQDNLLHGFVLIVGLVWLFLRSLRGSLIVAAVIPLSLLAAFTGLYSLGMSANLISMGAIDFGILVDGAVVLVENVIHQVQEHKPKTNRERLQLVIHAALDVGQPTFYAMMIIIAALIPVFTLQRVEGRIFQPLALTYSFALVAALIFAFTVVPALCALLLKTQYVKGEEPAFLERLRRTYTKVLTHLLARRPAAIAGALVLLALGGLAGSRLGTEFLPELDEGDMFIFAEMPPSISLEQGQATIAEIRRRLLTFPEVRGTLSEQGRPESGTDNETVNLGKVTVLLRPRDEWRPGLDKDDLIDAMRENLNQIPGVIFNFSQPIRDTVEESLAGARGQVVLKLFGSDFQAMRATLLQAKATLRDVPGIVDLDLYRDAIVPQLRIDLDRPALARNGISVKTAQDTIQTTLAGRVVTELWEQERPVPIRVSLPFAEKSDARKIEQITVETPADARIPLNDLAEIRVAVGPASVFREDNSRFLALKFNVDGRDLGSVVNDARHAVSERVKAPEGHFFVWTGEFENQQRAMARLQLVVPIAVAIVMALLYGALNSGRSAAAIMLTVPFALTGGVFALLLTDIHLSISAAVGFIALLGQVSLMGLLILSAVETRRRAGQELIPAILAGARERLRAILMASLLALFGLLPMAMSTGVGSETQKPFAVVIVGGMVTTLLVALFVLPAFYTYLTPERLLTPEEQDEL